MGLVTIVFCVLIIIATFLVWEFIAWSSHKYIKHGFLWTCHKSHHSKHEHALERNDLFALIFSMPCVGLFYYASIENYYSYSKHTMEGCEAFGFLISSKKYQAKHFSDKIERQETQ